MVNKQKILIVDDDANIAELISLYLTKECFDTMIVEDGESALRAVDTFAPNLILLDLMLPGIDGYQVCREVRSSSSVPIIMLSAKGEIFDKVLGLELGFIDCQIGIFDTLHSRLCRNGSSWLVAAQHRFDSCDKLLGVEGLFHVIIRTKLHAEHLVKNFAVPDQGML